MRLLQPSKAVDEPLHPVQLAAHSVVWRLFHSHFVLLCLLCMQIINLLTAEQHADAILTAYPFILNVPACKWGQTQPPKRFCTHTPCIPSAAPAVQSEAAAATHRGMLALVNCLPDGSSVPTPAAVLHAMLCCGSAAA